MRISRRALLTLLPAASTLRARDVLAQRRTGPARVGWLSYLPSPDPAVQILRAGFRELSYAEGKSFVLVPRYADGDFTRLPRLVEELAGERLDVLVSRGPSVDYAKAITSRVPVVFAYSGDPVAAGFADSLSKPGRNMTGITFMAFELSAKRVEVLKEMVPRASRIALLSNPEHAGELAEYRVTDEAARRVGSTITRYLARNPAELTSVFDDIRGGRPDAMLVFPDSMTLARRKEIVDFATQARIPTMYAWTEFAESGGLVSYGPGLTENFKSLARFADKILNGAGASTIPIEQVSRITLTINATAARRIGLEVPSAFLARADRVIDQ